jgi:hypothetical protein
MINSQLQSIITQLEQPIETLVKDCQVIRSALEPIMDKLPVALKQVLQPTAYLEFFREEVLAAASRLSARENQDALKEQISKECVVANQLKARLARSAASSLRRPGAPCRSPRAACEAVPN